MRELYPRIRVEREGGVTTVTLDSPEVKNACSGDMWVALGQIFRDASYDGTRCILLTGAGGNFCAGADLSGASGGLGGGGGVGAGEPAPGNSSNLHGMRVLGETVLAIHNTPVPVVAKVDGICVGAGLGLALSADVTYCSDRARFSAIFAKRGLSLDFGTSWLLRQRLPVHKAKELALTAKMVSGPEAFELGFVNGVFAADELDARVDEVLQTIAGGPPLALSMSKREIDNAADIPLAAALEAEATAQGVNVNTADMKEAFMSFFEKRTPDFQGG